MLIRAKAFNEEGRETSFHSKSAIKEGSGEREGMAEADRQAVAHHLEQKDVMITSG